VLDEAELDGNGEQEEDAAITLAIAHFNQNNESGKGLTQQQWQLQSRQSLICTQCAS